MPADAIRTNIVNQLKTIAGLGGDEKKVFPYSFESDDVDEAKVFWESTQSTGFPAATKKVINAAAVTRLARRQRETATGGIRLFKRIHRFRVLFRYGLPGDTQAEKTFETFLESILNKIEGNDTIFHTPGVGVSGNFHPDAQDADQTAEVAVANKKLFHTRVWEAEVDFEVVEHVKGTVSP